MFRKYLYSNFSSEIERLSVCMLGEGVKKGQIKRFDMKPVLFDEILTSQSTFGKQTYTHTHSPLLLASKNVMKIKLQTNSIWMFSHFI